MSFKDFFSLISRVFRLEDRVSMLERKIENLQVPPKDVKEGLEYDKDLNVYFNRPTGEDFCPTCIGNNKRIAVQIKSNAGEKYWYCDNCKSHGQSKSHRDLPRSAITD